MHLKIIIHKKITFLLTFMQLILVGSISAQNLDWVAHIGGFSNEIPYDLTVDDSGYVYSTGSFWGTVDFDPSPDSMFLSSAGFAEEVFVQKLDGDGNLIWAKNFGGPVLQWSSSLVVDDLYNVYTTGIYYDTVDFDPDTAAVAILEGNTDMKVFVQKLDANGNFVWVKSLGGSSYIRSESMTVDNSNNIYITGYFGDTIDFDPGPGISNKISNGMSDIFIVKLDENGNFVWVKTIGGTGSDKGTFLTGDGSNNIYLSGFFYDTVDFDPNSGVVNLSTDSIYMNPFVLKLDENGNFVWAKSMGGSDYGTAEGIAIDPVGNVLTIGQFMGTMDFDPNIGTFNLTATGLSDIYIQKLDGNGNFIWAKGFGGSQPDLAAAIDVDNLGNIYTTGTFYGTADFDPGAGVQNVSVTGRYDAYVQKLDAAGNFVWAFNIGGYNRDNGVAIAVDHDRNVYTIGDFEETADFDPGAGVLNITAKNVSDIFIQKLDSTTNVSITKVELPLVKIYPNPTNGLINVDLGHQVDVSIAVYTLDGQLIYYKENIYEQIHQVDLKESVGVFFLEIDAQNKKQHFKLIKNHE